MAEPLKTFFDRDLVMALGRELSQTYAGCDRRRFVAEALCGLEDMELVARASHLADVMFRHLPAAYPDAVRVLLESLGPKVAPSSPMAPFRYLPHVLFVGRYGLEHFEPSMSALYELTQRFTAEGGIRPFLTRYPAETLARLRVWASDPNVHVRRLVSEGTRPRLPWAPRLRQFQRDPAPVIELLELLKDDTERYVQRSVANNLNDIAKDNADLAVAVCARWSSAVSPSRRWIVKHALRSLVKAGHAGALDLLGAGRAPELSVRGVKIEPRRVALGEKIAISFELVSEGAGEQDLIVDYAVHYVKADGSARPKVFKLRRVRLGQGCRVSLATKVSFMDLTTRKHYPGRHRLELRINGATYPLGECRVRA